MQAKWRKLRKESGRQIKFVGFRCKHAPLFVSSQCLFCGRINCRRLCVIVRHRPKYLNSNGRIKESKATNSRQRNKNMISFRFACVVTMVACLTEAIWSWPEKYIYNSSSNGFFFVTFVLKNIPNALKTRQANRYRFLLAFLFHFLYVRIFFILLLPHELNLVCLLFDDYLTLISFCVRTIR